MGDAADGVTRLLAELSDLDRPAWNATPGSGSVDFCENNYEVGEWVAEAWTALASLCAAALGLGGAVVAYTHDLEPRMTLLWVLGGWWALATAMMHATLSARGQFLHEALMLALGLCVFFCVVRLKDGQLMQAPAGLKPVPRAEWRTSDRITPFKKLLFPFALVALWLLACWQLSLGQLWMEPMVGSGCQALSAMTVLKATRSYRSYTARHLRRFAERSVLCLCAAFWLWFADVTACQAVRDWAEREGYPFPQPRAWSYGFVGLGLHSGCVWLLLVRSELTGTPLPESLVRRQNRNGFRLAARVLGVAAEEYRHVGLAVTADGDASGAEARELKKEK